MKCTVRSGGLRSAKSSGACCDVFNLNLFQNTLLIARILIQIKLLKGNTGLSRCLGVLSVINKYDTFI